MPRTDAVHSLDHRDEPVVPARAGTPARPDAFGWLVAVVATGVGAYAGSRWLVPAPARSDLAWSWIAEIGTTVSAGLALAGALCCLHDRPRVGFALLAAGAWTLLAVAVGCPATGHHRAGAWWAGQIALTVAFTAVATVAWAAHRRRRSRPR